MKLVFASDSFKGSLSSKRIISLLTQAAQTVFPHAQTQGVLMADGGEGTMEALVEQLGGKRKEVLVHDPLFHPVQSSYGILPGETAIIEMAAASGLPMVPSDKRDPSQTTTFGTGELIADALSKGIQKIVIAIGGSATNDGGMGMLSALGVRFMDLEGKQLRGCGDDLEKIHSIDVSHLHPKARDTEFIVLCDVNNPLLGPQGATYTFSAQKGADSAMQERLEAGMAHYAAFVEEVTGVSGKSFPGSGAAGGLGFGLITFLGAKLQSGIETVLDLIGFDKLLQDADLVVTGEGRMDWQSAYGKVPAGVASRCKKWGVPVVAVVGGLLPGYEKIYECGIESIVTTVNGVMGLEEALAQSENLYLDAAIRLFRGIRCGMKLQN